MKKIFISFLIIVVLGSIVAYYLYNKAPESIEQVAKMTIDAKTLIADYEIDEQGANAKYLNKALSISGKVTEISLNQDNQTVLFLSEDGITGVQATMKTAVPDIKTGDVITIDGFCTGYIMSVLLNDCIINKK